MVEYVVEFNGKFRRSSWSDWAASGYQGTLLYLVELRNGSGMYGVSEAKGDWKRSEKIWLRPIGGGDYEPASMRFRGSEPPEGTHYGMTYAEALQAGYVPSGTALQRGYVSRLADPNKAEVLVAGGTRHGQLYVTLNNPNSNRYCIRQYLRRREVWEK